MCACTIHTCQTTDNSWELALPCCRVGLGTKLRSWGPHSCLCPLSPLSQPWLWSAWDRILLCSPGWPQAHGLPASAFSVLNYLSVCASTPGSNHALKGWLKPDRNMWVSLAVVFTFWVNFTKNQLEADKEEMERRPHRHAQVLLPAAVQLCPLACRKRERASLPYLNKTLTPPEAHPQFHCECTALTWRLLNSAAQILCFPIFLGCYLA